MKPYTRELRIKDNVLHVKLAGTYPRERLEKTTNIFDPLIDACREDKCRAAVIDARDLEAELDTHEMFRAGIDAAALNQHGFYVAFVARKDMLDAFFRDVLQNRGALAAIFTDMDSAMTWVHERIPSAG